MAFLSNRGLTSSLASKSTLKKRSQPCTNGSVIVEHQTFQVTCGLGFESFQTLQIAYVDSFQDCMLACVTLDEPAGCLGVNHLGNVSSTEMKGSLCWLLFDVTNPRPNSSSDTNIAILKQPDQSTPEVFIPNVDMIDSRRALVNQEHMSPRPMQPFKFCAKPTTILTICI